MNLTGGAGTSGTGAAVAVTETNGVSPGVAVGRGTVAGMVNETLIATLAMVTSARENRKGLAEERTTAGMRLESLTRGGMKIKVATKTFTGDMRSAGYTNSATKVTAARRSILDGRCSGR